MHCYLFIIYTDGHLIVSYCLNLSVPLSSDHSLILFGSTSIIVVRMTHQKWKFQGDASTHNDLWYACLWCDAKKPHWWKKNNRTAGWRRYGMNKCGLSWVAIYRVSRQNVDSAQSEKVSIEHKPASDRSMPNFWYDDSTTVWLFSSKHSICC